MTRALFRRLSTLAAVTLALSLIPQSSFAQHGGGGGGFHGGGTAFHNGGFGGGFHSGGSFHGGGFGGFHGGGFHRGFGGFPNRFGRGWGWGGWGGWSSGWGLGWGWPWWYGYPSNAYWAPYAYGCPNYGYCNPYYPPGNGPGDVDPPSNGPGTYPQGNNSEPDWRHELGPNRQPTDVQPGESEPEPSDSPGSASSPDSKLIIVKYVTPPNSDEDTLRSGRSHYYLVQSHPQPVLPTLRPGVRNAIILLRRIPPAARERWLASGRYSKFSPEEQQMLRKYAGLTSEF